MEVQRILETTEIFLKDGLDIKEALILSTLSDIETYEQSTNIPEWAKKLGDKLTKKLFLKRYQRYQKN